MSKRVVITGANAGIGKEAAVQLARNGFHVVLACRSAERGEAARHEVIERSGSEAVEVIPVDTSRQKSIRGFCEAYAAKHGTLDVLINNAAQFDVTQKERQMTDEGFESVWATNHLGPFLLNMTLAPLLQKSSGGGRILNVSSKGLLVHPFLKLDLKDPSLSSRRFSMPRSYYHSKLAVVMSTLALAERFRPRGITVNTIRVTSVRIDISRYPDISDFQKRLYAIKSQKSIEPSVMAETYTYLAASDEVKDWTGRHVDEHHRAHRYRPYELRADVLQELYELSLRSVGLPG